MESKRRTLLGIILVIVGIALLLDNLHLIPGLPSYLFFWANIFLVLAVVTIISHNRKASFVFLVFWAFFTLDRYYYFDFEDYWPLIVVAIGVSFIIKDKPSRRSIKSGENYFDDINVFSASNKRVTSMSFEGGKTTNIFGSSTIDLRECSPVDGATIEIFSMFGGCDIIAPPEWDVIIETTSILASFEDKREHVNALTDYKIYVRGLNILAGGAIKSAK